MTAPRLPHHRKYNWRIAYRNNRRAVWLLLSIALLGTLVFFGIWHASTHLDLASSEYRLAELRYDIARQANFGAPGFTLTDWKENTEGMDK